MLSHSISLIANVVLSSMSSMLKNNLGLLEVLNPDISSMDNIVIKVVFKYKSYPRPQHDGGGGQ